MGLLTKSRWSLKALVLFSDQTTEDVVELAPEVVLLTP